MLRQMPKHTTPNSGSDLHVSKDSHLSAPVAHNLELHMRNEEVPETKPGNKHHVHIPVEVTSRDENMTRYKQISALEIHDMPQPQSNGTNKLKAIAKKHFNARENKEK